MTNSIKFILALSLAALTLSGCKKNYLPISDHPFDISISKVESNRVVVDMIPDNNDFYYIFGVCPAAAYDALGTNAFVKYVDEASKDAYKALYETTSLDDYNEWLYRGAYDEIYHDLTPDTKYIVFAFPYDNLNPLSDKFTKFDFSTPAITKSDITFTVSVDSTVISFVPSNGDPYFFDYCAKDELKDYYSSIDYFFRKTIDIYWEYDFLDSFISKGPDKNDLKEYYSDIADGDEFYMAASGYDKGITTDVTYYKITVHFGDTVKSTVEEIPDFDKNITD